MCGVVGMASQQDKAAELVYFGLFALQHRGQEAAGIAASHNGEVFLSKAMGTIDWVFRKRTPIEDLASFVLDNQDMPRAELNQAAQEFNDASEKRALDQVPGNIAIGHVRYSTTGASGKKNIHPILFEFRGRPAFIAHNGNLVRLEKLRTVVEKRGGYNFSGTTDTELIAALIATSLECTFYNALLETLPLLMGAFSLVFLYDDTVYAVKDAFGIRPLCIGKREDAYIAASETRALDIMEAKFVKELDPGEGAVLRPDGITYFTWRKNAQWRTCLFESGVYFSMPDSILRGKEAHEIRKTAGMLTAKSYPVHHADKVFSIPDSGNSAAEGYGEELSALVGRPLHTQGIVRSHFVGRTFIEVVVELRHQYRRIKYNPIRSEVEDKVVVLVDDSIVRGTTTPYVVALLKRLGAKEIHMRVASPPLRYGCHLGVDLPFDEDLIAYERTVEEIRSEINRQAIKMARGAGWLSVPQIFLDSLEYLSLDDLLNATGLPKDSFCTGCFNKNWPVPREEDAYDPKGQ